VSLTIQVEVADGTRCAVCERLFSEAPGVARYIRAFDVMVHVDCDED